jgi:7-cyano-7-deazaguanine synthase
MTNTATLFSRTVLLLSGGLDSSVLLYHLRAEGSEIRALSVNYEQRHKKELDAASALAARVGVEHRIADLSSVADLLTGSALTSPGIAVPLGHYEDETMKQTVVPNRNMILLSLATGWAVSTRSDAVAYAAHNGDHAIYPDCRAEFADTMAQAIALCDWHPVALRRPFVDFSKADIVRRGAELGVPFELTWSCYQGSEIHCGQCGTCVERREAFELAGIADPTPYAETARFFAVALSV